MTPRDVAFEAAPSIPERYARHALVEGWEHDRIARLRIAVLGIGALGNEVVKNLALLGVGHLLLVDRDRIETSNLSRSVLFRDEDRGRPKAEVAAERAVELAPGLVAVPLVSDLAQDLGPARLEGYDAAVACLDSIDARIRTNRLCRAAGIPWWNGGLGETACELQRFEPDDGPCYECTLGDRARRREAARWSCQEPRVEFDGRPLPTTAIAASLGGALLASEIVLTALPAFRGRRTPEARRLLLEAAPPRLTPFDVPRDPACPAHLRPDPPRRLVVDHRASGRRLLDTLDAPRSSELHLGFDLVIGWRCGCEPDPRLHPIPVRRFALRCGTCGEPTRDVVTTASLAAEHAALSLPLRDLGVADGADLVLATPAGLLGLRLALTLESCPPMSDLELTIRSAQGDRKVACTVPDDYRAEEILEGLRREWHLAAEHDFVLRVVRTGRQLAPNEPLATAGVRSGDELELFPVLVAGASG